MSRATVEKTKERLQKKYTIPSIIICARVVTYLTNTHRIEEGSYYEAHQQLRVLCQRYIKQNNYEAAAQIVYSGAQALLKAGQGGMGGDLCSLLIDVYQQGQLKPTSENMGEQSRIPFGKSGIITGGMGRI